MTRTSLILFAWFLVWAVVYYTHWVVIRRRFVAITPGSVYQCGAMWPWWLLRYVRHYRIDTVVDFRGPRERGVSAQVVALSAANIRYIRIPLGILPTQAELRQFIDAMAEELCAGRRVLMHCKDGQGRAIAMAAIYRVEFEGWSPERAYRAGTRLPPGFKFVSLLFPGAGLISPRNPKSRYILDYQRSLPPLAARPGAYVSEAGI